MKIRTTIKSYFIITLVVSGCLIQSCKQENDDEGKFEFNENIRSTEAQTPEQERLGFKLPDGFEIQLFASEPDISKPINITFDAKGRMWVTQSTTYPMPAEDVGKDRITILEDTDGDGKADRFTGFSDTLNVPIGVLPTESGALAFSIPNVYQFNDPDRDGKADESMPVIGKFGFVDTHGMVSNFVRGYDGWVHGCHGFTNKSTVAGTDGDSITLISGNTFRFRLDGSRIEQTTFGQVNPFGLVYDELGYIYSTDSHSSPLYQLITGGDYPHFGKEEIMGFGPDMKSFEDEATALCGIAYYADVLFPQEFQKNFFVGDAVKSRVHRYSWEFKGSSPVGKSEIDLVKSADPWFRPVNIKLGPDGAIYIADFYNAIIGHYEVPLGHPKRDKTRGRIWRITYKGQHNEVPDLSKSQLNELIEALGHDNMTIRMTATDQITDRIGQKAGDPLKALLSSSTVTTQQYVQALWALHRLNIIDNDLIIKAAAHTSPVVRLHAIRILTEKNLSPSVVKDVSDQALKDKDPHVRRAAIELLKKSENLESLQTALGLVNDIDTVDTHLYYTLRLTVRSLLKNEDLLTQVNAREWTQKESDLMAGVLIEVYSDEAVIFLAKYLGRNDLPMNKTPLAYRLIARMAEPNLVRETVEQARPKYREQPELASAIFKEIQQGINQRQTKIDKGFLQPWVQQIVTSTLSEYPLTDTVTNSATLARQAFACELSGEFMLTGFENQMKDFLLLNGPSTANQRKLRTATFRSLIKISRKNIGLAKELLTSQEEDVAFKKEIAQTLGEFHGNDINDILVSIDNAPPGLQSAIASALANTAEGKDLLFKQVRKGAIIARTLLDPKVEEKIRLNITKKQSQEYEDITGNLSPVSEEKQKIIQARLEGFREYEQTSANLDSGRLVFNKNCSVCHRRGNQVGIGPQLNGIGKRGPEAIIEKILDPNRNISEAFRNYTIRLKDGNVVSGLYRRDLGDAIILADMSGREFSVPKNDIEVKEASRYTLMPDNFSETISEKDFNNLITYLLSW